MSDTIEVTPSTSALSVTMDDDGDICINRYYDPESEIELFIYGEEIDNFIHAIELLRKNQKEAGNVN